MSQVKAIPAVDTTPSGRALPYIPEPGREHPENIAAKLGLAEGVTLDQLTAVLPAVVDQAMRTALPGHYSPEVAERIAADMIARLRQQQDDKPSACQYRDCEDTEPGHYDHYNHRLRVTGEDGSTILDAGMAALSGSESGAVVYVRNEEFTTAAAVRAKTAEIRRLLDQVDAMADRVFADHQARA
ncbi:hypothetical protein [Streptomyces diastatochromogenes]|uniref:hypothetical protein n=1 Tax=Streptomyces diastatochromogenes TaxID=42236 RepID=UPI0036AD3229